MCLRMLSIWLTDSPMYHPQRKGSSAKFDTCQRFAYMQDTRQPEDPEKRETDTEGKVQQQQQQQDPDSQGEASKGRRKPITFPDSNKSPGSNPPSGTQSNRASAPDPASPSEKATTPAAAAQPESRPEVTARGSTPSRRRDSVEHASKESTPVGTAAGANGAEQAGSKRKRPVIVFDPQPSDAKEMPPQKRDKVELVVEVPTEVTCALRVNGLKRPLRESDLKAILQETGCVLRSVL